MAQTQARIGIVQKSSGTVYRLVETGTANTSLTSTMAARGSPYRVIAVTISYSAAPTEAGTTVTLASGAGAAYNCVLSTGTANTQYNSFIPQNDLILAGSDGLTVVAPAGGAGITASVAIYIQHL